MQTRNDQKLLQPAGFLAEPPLSQVQVLLVDTSSEDRLEQSHASLELLDEQCFAWPPGL